MCFTASLSRNALIFGMLSSLALLQFGKDNNENKILAYFFMFVSLMQYVEYLIWTDLNCKNGNNKLAGIIGPLLNYLQPVVLLLLILFYKNEYDTIPLLLNLIYVLYIFKQYYVYLQKDDLCSKKTKGHLSWSWKNYRDYNFYNIIMIFNILYFLNSNNAMFAFALSYIYFFISATKLSYHMGEFWCYLVTNIPLAIIIFEKINK